MADLPISSAASLTGATIATGDLIPVLDISAASGSKGSKITVVELFTGRSITGGTAVGLTGLGLRSTGAAFDLTLASAEVLTAGRTLTFNVGDADRTLTVPATGTAALLGRAQSFTGINTFAPTTPGSAIVITSGTVTTSLPFLTASQTWNASGVAFVGSKITITDTASAAGSLAFQILGDSAGTTNLFSVDRKGRLIFGTVSSTSPTTATADAFQMALGCNGASGLNLISNVGVATFSVGGSNALQISSTTMLLTNQSVAIQNSSTAATFYLFAKTGGAICQHGLDAAGVTNQMITAANRITSDGVGADLTIAPGNGRGAAGGTLILSTFTTAGASTAGTLTSRMTIDTAGAIAFPNVTAVVSETVVSDRTLAVSINGTAYKICLKV